MDGGMSPKEFKKELKKLVITAHPFDQYGGKFWVAVYLKSSKWVPSFEELFWIVKFISFCENEKYPPEKGFKGWRMVAEFMADACKPGATWEELKQKADEKINMTSLFMVYKENQQPAVKQLMESLRTQAKELGIDLKAADLSEL